MLTTLFVCYRVEEGQVRSRREWRTGLHVAEWRAAPAAGAPAGAAVVSRVGARQAHEETAVLPQRPLQLLPNQTPAAGLSM